MNDADAAKRTAVLQEIARQLPQYAGILGEIDAALWRKEHPYDPLVNGMDRTLDGTN